MSTSFFTIKTHKVPCSHIREYPRALSTPEETQLYLSVKQYTPKPFDNSQASSNPAPAITIVASQANAFPKELYEPLWDDLLSYSQRLILQNKPSFRIASIFMSDVAHQGTSYHLNDHALGNDPSWHDHTRDLQHLINILRPPPPIFAVGHSMGGAQLVDLSLFNPRLFTGLILLDPVIQPRTTEVLADESGKTQPNLATLSTFRRDTWPSRDAARQAFGKSPFYQSWDRRVFDRWIDHGLRECPTLLYPDTNSTTVTLATPVSMEVYQFSRPNFQGNGKRSGRIERATHADVDPDNENSYPFYRSEPNRTFLRLEEVQPSVLYISGSASPVSQSIPDLDQTRLSCTGTGIGGSGGAKEGKVKLVTLEGVGHLVAMEEKGLKETVEAAGDWLGEEARKWKEEQERLQRTWFDGTSAKEKQEISEEWKKFMGGPPEKRKRDTKM